MIKVISGVQSHNVVKCGTRALGLFLHPHEVAEQGELAIA